MQSSSPGHSALELEAVAAVATWRLLFYSETLYPFLFLFVVVADVVVVAAAVAVVVAPDFVEILRRCRDSFSKPFAASQWTTKSRATSPSPSR